MSRRSQAFAEGTQKFSWRIEEIQERDATADGRYKATRRNYPSVFAFGDTEQQAMRAAQAKLTTAAEMAELPGKAPGLTD